MNRDWPSHLRRVLLGEAAFHSTLVSVAVAVALFVVAANWLAAAFASGSAYQEVAAWTLAGIVAIWLVWTALSWVARGVQFLSNLLNGGSGPKRKTEHLGKFKAAAMPRMLWGIGREGLWLGTNRNQRVVVVIGLLCIAASLVAHHMWGWLDRRSLWNAPHTNFVWGVVVPAFLTVVALFVCAASPHARDATSEQPLRESGEGQ